MKTTANSVKVSVDAIDHWFLIELLLLRLRVLNSENYSPGLSRLTAFTAAVKQHTGITNPYFIQGNAVYYHDY